jgi:hypothetical protein
VSGALRAIGKPLSLAPKQSVASNEPDWLCALKLHCQVLVRRLELRHLRSQVRRLTVKSRELLAQQADMNAHSSGRAMLNDKLLYEVQGTEVELHGVWCVNRPNDRTERQPPEVEVNRG